MRAAYPVRNNSSKFLEVSSVTKRYRIAERTIEAVRDVGFTLSRGEVLGIVGESGSGKSTLSRQLLQLEKTDEGSIRYESEEVTAMNKRSLRSLYRRAQMVFQIPLTSFDQNKRIRATMKDAVRNLTDRKIKNTADAYINELMYRVGLAPELADRYPWEISGDSVNVLLLPALWLPSLNFLFVTRRPVRSMFLLRHGLQTCYVL